eukprot:TRINITY_DN4074_c1_g2_i2.p1 TRINITY_DN4074_c1_g2~~TRINITY_DN4074_c1_g2_i2.p1  ORF type:complete len:335 (-),score=102.39 TRINITY_DN4074_c1_g2_i2:470-1411(-)
MAVGKGQKGKGQGGKAGGKGVGTWVWVPDSGSRANVVAKVQKAIQFQKTPLRPFSGGKGQGGKGGQTISKWGEKLKKTDPSLKAWVGGLAESTTWKELENHFAEAATKPLITEIMKKGQAVLAYKTVEEVETAIATLNGTELGGNTIEVDVWVKTAKPEREESTKNRKGPKPVAPAAKKAVKPVQKPDLKSAQKNQKTIDEKMFEKLKAFDSTQKVWIGGLAEGTHWKELADHLATVAKPKITHMMKKGTACAAFESADDAASVIGTFADVSELGGKTIQCDVWTQSEKKERPKRGNKGGKGGKPGSVVKEEI